LKTERKLFRVNNVCFVNTILSVLCTGVYLYWGLSEGKYSVRNRKERIENDWKRNTCGQQQRNADFKQWHPRCVLITVQ